MSMTKSSVNPSRGGRTRSSEKDACDVNVIVAAHKRGGVSAHVVQRVAEYGFVPALTFADCMNEVRKAEELFAELPSETRARFANSPARFVEFCSKPENVDELVKFNLATPKVVPAPVLGSAENPIVTRSVDAGTPAS